VLDSNERENGVFGALPALRARGSGRGAAAEFRLRREDGSGRGEREVLD
jgi:hypothetical protein